MNKCHVKFERVVDKLIKQKVENEDIKAVILGGSVARGDETKHSDIDIVFYVSRKNLPSQHRSFYRFNGKYIEEHYGAIEDLKQEDILPESKILYDKTGKIKKKDFDIKCSEKKFKEEVLRAKKFQRDAEKFYKKRDYNKAFYHLYGLESPNFILVHALPPRFNLPFPSFRLFESIKKIDQKNNTEFYKKIEIIYHFNNLNKREILRSFSKAYYLMNKIKKSDNKNLKNLGFFDKIKIRYNLCGLKLTFKEYPFVYAYRFIAGCLVEWAIEDEKKYNKEIYKILLKVLGVPEIERKLVAEKMKLSKELIMETEKL